MAVDNLKVFGGQAAGGTSGGDLCWFAPAGTTGPVAVTYTADVQTVTVTATGGTLTYTWNGITLAAQAFNVANATLTTAMNTAWAAYLRTGSIAVTGTPGTNQVITFPAAVGLATLITLSVTSLTGGSATIAHTTPGAGANPATAVIPAAFKSGGWMDTTLTMKVSDTTKDVGAFGATSPVRTFFSGSKKTFDITFVESNHVAFEIYHRLAIGATGVAGLDGYISGVVDGPPVTQQYAYIQDVVDGNNHLRAYAPYVQNTNMGDLSIPFGDAVRRPFTLTAYPDSTGVAVYWYPVIGALAGL